MVDKVGYSKPVVNAKALRKAAKTGAAGFADALAGAEAAYSAGDAEALASATGVNATNPLLGFQEVDTADYEKKKAVKQGKTTLDALTQLRDALLMGTLPVSTIKRLEQVLQSERSKTTDPLLNGVLDEIELRAAVEMAKLEVALRDAQ